jgi:hypothetical protein
VAQQVPQWNGQLIGIPLTLGVAQQTLSGWAKDESDKHHDAEPTHSDVATNPDVLEYDELQLLVQNS